MSSDLQQKGRRTAPSAPTAAELNEALRGTTDELKRKQEEIDTLTATLATANDEIKSLQDKLAAGDSVPLGQLRVLVPYSTDNLPTEFGVHVDIRLSGRESTALRKVAAALDREQAVLSSGQRVTEITHAARYIFQSLARALP